MNVTDYTLMDNGFCFERYGQTGYTLMDNAYCFERYGQTGYTLMDNAYCFERYGETGYKLMDNAYCFERYGQTSYTIMDNAYCFERSFCMLVLGQNGNDGDLTMRNEHTKKITVTLLIAFRQYTYLPCIFVLTCNHRTGIPLYTARKSK
ncbi:hypothetical protein CHS0354_041751 [Potamilus streckersoni]|uniref:Uncharacterized protein n=1 Tax=Potamilus streckersoni TaxID=2493646 RepID=A0AAE0W529_9BIVA|nr:hypothetical protein CHS0354_041751 [Potamilus streckersoni]